MADISKIGGALKGAKEGALAQGKSGMIGGAMGARNAGKGDAGTLAGGIGGGLKGLGAGAVKGGIGGFKNARDMNKLGKMPPTDLRQAANQAAHGKIPNMDLRSAANAAKDQLIAEAKKKAAMFLLTNPIFWIVVGIVLLILFIIFMITSSTAERNSNQDNKPLTITKTGPTSAKKGDTLDYTIDVEFAGSAQNMVVTDPLPDGTEYVGSDPKADNKNQTITWDAKALKLTLGDPISQTFQLTLKATKDNVHIINFATVSITGGVLDAGAGGGAASGGGDVPANHDTCSGKYASGLWALNNPYGNFGDPQCNFTQQALDTLIKQLDSANYYTWDCIAKHESLPQYNPNSYLKASTSGKGAFGLFQMNPKGQGNGQYDAGNVNWPVQTSNAINYRNKIIHGSWAYWQTYSQYCS
ncbi:MAG TPA: hypothetical protein VLF93_01585 [Candidatus Saccharimonadales bacterium]|nr:hypothetical protein [Candidatus Saccharimonadales bacterium]